MRANALVVLAKAPVAGQVKTRLFAALGPELAARLTRAMLIDQLKHLERLSAAELYLAFAPEAARSMMTDLAPAVFRLFPQSDGDLGRRMQAAFERVFRAGHRRVLLIGSDLPAVPVRFFAQAYKWLRSSSHCVVLGPSRDGGYYLAGCNRATPALFSEMTWSHSQVLAETLARLDGLKIVHHLLPPWFDIDTIGDLHVLAAGESIALARSMPETFSFLRRAGVRKALRAWRADGGT